MQLFLYFLMLPPTFENKARWYKCATIYLLFKEGRNKYDDVNETMPAVADKTDREGIMKMEQTGRLTLPTDADVVAETCG